MKIINKMRGVFSSLVNKVDSVLIFGVDYELSHQRAKESAMLRRRLPSCFIHKTQLVCKGSLHTAEDDL